MQSRWWKLWQILCLLLSVNLVACASLSGSSSAWPSVRYAAELMVYSCPLFVDEGGSQFLRVSYSGSPNHRTWVAIICNTGDSTGPAMQYGAVRKCPNGRVEIKARNGHFGSEAPVEGGDSVMGTAEAPNSLAKLYFAETESRNDATVPMAYVTLECIPDQTPVQPLPPAEAEPRPRLEPDLI